MSSIVAQQLHLHHSLLSSLQYSLLCFGYSTFSCISCLLFYVKEISLIYQLSFKPPFLSKEVQNNQQENISNYMELKEMNTKIYHNAHPFFFSRWLAGSAASLSTVSFIFALSSVIVNTCEQKNLFHLPTCIKLHKTQCTYAVMIKWLKKIIRCFIFNIYYRYNYLLSM